MSEARKNPVEFDVPDCIERRWSPIAYSAEAVDAATLAALFEAARWAASCFNEQPWRFVLARRDDAERFGPMLDCLVPPNREWAQHAGALVIVCAMNEFGRNGKPNPHAWFDSGQATTQLMLTAVHHGLHCRAMGGFDAQKARELLQIPEQADPVCAVAIGRLDDGSRLEAGVAARDQAVRDRHSLDEIVFEGSFGSSAKLG